jgi:hypothetical protein
VAEGHINVLQVNKFLSAMCDIGSVTIVRALVSTREEYPDKCSWQNIG